MNSIKKNVSKWVGIRRTAGENCWSASINIGGERVYLGSFLLRDDALAARVEFEKRVLGDYAPIRRST